MSNTSIIKAVNFFEAEKFLESNFNTFSLDG